MKHTLALITILFTFFSCEDDKQYLIDGGVSDGHVGTTTMAFFKSHYQLDTLALLIERAGLANQTNGETTFFAPTNLSIKRYVNRILADLRQTDPLAKYTLNDIPTDTLKKYMGGYIFPGKITREDMLQEGKIFTAINGEERRISLETVLEYRDQLETYPKYVFYTYKIGNDWDAWNDIVDDKKIVIRTSNLISTNGVIHVLQGNHILFNYKP
jgi:Fasciclin domain